MRFKILVGERGLSINIDRHGCQPSCVIQSPSSALHIVPGLRSIGVGHVTGISPWPKPRKGLEGEMKVRLWQRKLHDTADAIDS